MRPSLLIRYMCWEPHFCGVCRPRPYAGAYSDQWPLLESRFTEKPLTWPFWGEWPWVSSLCINKLNKFSNWNPQPTHLSPSSTVLTPSIYLLPLILKCLRQCLLHHLTLLWMSYCLSLPSSATSRNFPSTTHMVLYHTTGGSTSPRMSSWNGTIKHGHLSFILGKPEPFPGRNITISSCIDRPVLNGRRVPLSEFCSLRHTHMFQNPCCLCTMESPDGSTITESAVFMMTTTNLAG